MKKTQNFLFNRECQLHKKKTLIDEGPLGRRARKGGATHLPNGPGKDLSLIILFGGRRERKYEGPKSPGTHEGRGYETQVDTKNSNSATRPRDQGG